MKYLILILSTPSWEYFARNSETFKPLVSSANKDIILIGFKVVILSSELAFGKLNLFLKPLGEAALLTVAVWLS